MAKKDRDGTLIKPPVEHGQSDPNMVDPTGRYLEPKTDKKPSESPEPR